MNVNSGAADLMMIERSNGGGTKRKKKPAIVIFSSSADTAIKHQAKTQKTSMTDKKQQSSQATRPMTTKPGAADHHSKLMLMEQMMMAKLTKRAGGGGCGQATGAGAGTTTTGRSSDIRVRYWKYLFENLKRSIDEIYQSCENDESIDQCKEVLFILENCINDFRSLIRRIKVIQDFDKADSANKRPNSLAWEVRKSSPIKPTSSASMSSSSVTNANNNNNNTQTPDLIRANSSHRLDKIENFLLLKQSSLNLPPPPPPQSNMNFLNVVKNSGSIMSGSDTIKSGHSTNSAVSKQREDDAKAGGLHLTGFQDFPLYASTVTTTTTAVKKRTPDRDDDEDEEEDDEELFDESSHGECFGHGLDDDEDEDDEDEDDEDDGDDEDERSSRSAQNNNNNNNNNQDEDADADDEFNPIDLYNQETFNDIESMNLDEEMLMNEIDFSLSPTSHQSRQEMMDNLDESMQSGQFTNLAVLASLLKPSRSINNLAATTSSDPPKNSNSVYSPWTTFQGGYFQQQVPNMATLATCHAAAGSAIQSTALQNGGVGFQSNQPRVPNMDSPSSSDKQLASSMMLTANLLLNSMTLQSHQWRDSVTGEKASSTGGGGGGGGCHGNEYPGQPISLKNKGLTRTMAAAAKKKSAYLAAAATEDTEEQEDSNSNVSEVESVDLDHDDGDDDDDESDDNSDLESIKHYNQMIRAYEEEENWALRIEKEQEKKLRSVMAQEAKLTKQLSETQKHLAQNSQQLQQLVNKPMLAKSFAHELATTSKTSMDSEQSSCFDHHHHHDTSSVLLSKSSRTRSDLYQRAAPKSKSDWIEHQRRDLLGEVEQAMRSTPARALLLQEKLSFMSRKTSPSERRRIHEEKQARAQEKREQFYQDRSQKLRELTKKIEEVRELKKKLLKAKKASMKAKLQRAEEKRLCYLRLRAKKAAVEEQKAHEIAFINNLVAQNRKHDILEKYERRSEAIKHNLEEERLRKQEEQKAREHAAELRRKELETQRKSKLMQMIKKKEQKRFKIEQIQMEREKERLEAARVKEKTREMRLATLEAQNQANAQEAKKKFAQKQEECSKRHESNLEEMRKKAIKMSILRFSTDADQQVGDAAPTPVPYDKPKYCSACAITINSDIQLRSHLRGAKHQQTMNETSQGKNLSKSEIEEYNLSCIVDLPKEEQMLNDEKRKQAKKRLKKLKAKISNKAVELDVAAPASATVKPDKQTSPQIDSPNKQKLSRLVKELEKALTATSNGDNKLTTAVVNLDRSCGEISRMLQKSPADQNLFRSLDGLGISVKLLDSVFQSQADPSCANVANGLASSNKTITNIVNMLSTACKGNSESALDLMLTNKLMVIMDVLNSNSSVMLNEQNQIYDMVNMSTMSAAGLNNSMSSKLQQQTKCQISCSSVICASLAQLLCHLFSSVNSLLEQEDLSSTIIPAAVDTGVRFKANLISRATDFVSLMVYFGLVDMLGAFFNNIRGPLDDETSQQVTEILQTFLHFLIAVTKFLGLRKTTDLFAEGERHKNDDATHFLASLKNTNMASLISLIYGIMHKDASSTSIKYDQMTSSSAAAVVPHSSTLSMQTSKKLSTKTLELATLSLRLVNQIIVLDLNMVQTLLGEESLSVQLRHIASYLIWSFGQNKSDEILHEMILLIGYFTVLNNDNQIKIELGTPPTIIQQLCNLPFNYFSDKRLISILYPTLISCCYSNEKNKLVLTSELSCEMLTNFLEEKLNELTAQASLNSQANESTLASTSSSSSSTKQTNGHLHQLHQQHDAVSNSKFDLAKRFPSRLWKSAIDYFKGNKSL